jgi:hypothetical protein
MVKITGDVSAVRCWVIKSSDSDSNLELNNQPRSGKPVGATHDLNRQKLTNLFKKVYEGQLPDLHGDPKEAEKTNQSRSSGIKANASST